MSSDDGGLVPAQILVRLAALVGVLGGLYALYATRHEIERYVRIKQM